MTTKDIRFSAQARTQIQAGLDQLANAVKVTLGPRGRNVLLAQSWGSPRVTKDGVTVAREIELASHGENLGVQMIKEVASRTSENVGDGTTTATVLAQAIYTAGARLVVAGGNPMEIKQGIDIAVKAIVEDIARQAVPVQGRRGIAQIGTISANGDQEIGDLVAEAMDRVGEQGVVTVEESKSTETSLDFSEGMRFDRGYISPYFITDAERLETLFEDAYVLCHEKKLSSMRDLLPLLELVAREGKPLLVIADVDGDALSTLVVNTLRGSLKVCAVKAPSYGTRRQDILSDISVLLGGKAITSDTGTQLKALNLSDLGRASRVCVTKDSTTLVGGAGSKEEIEQRIRQLQHQRKEADSEHDQRALDERLAKLAGGVAVIRVGAVSESENKEKKDRVDDALQATRAAVEEGVVPGGGVALLRAVSVLSNLSVEGDQEFGVRAVRRALEEPLRQIARNAGQEPAIVAARVLEGSGAWGYNARSGVYEDLMQAGVIDPAKVVRVALESAASVAGLLLSTEASITIHEV